MADNIKGLKFFMEGRVNEWLAYKTDKEKIDGFLIEDGDHFVIDIIEQPFHCEASAENRDAKLELYIRNEFGAYMEPDLSIVIHPGNAKPEFRRSGKISGDGMKQLLLFMRAASVLKRYSDRFGFAKLYPDYDPDREGIIVRRDGDEPTFQRVRGKNRPPLAVRNMVGNVELARPYENELVSALGMELSAFEARLEEAEDGDTEAMRDIANKYVTGYEPEEIAPDPKKAFFWMNRLAEEGDADALYKVGLFSARGFGTPHSFEQAAELMHKAARAGHPKAKQAAAQYETMAKDEAKAKINDAQAMAELAASYMVLAGSQDKDNAEEDYEASRSWAEQSVKAGNGFGCWVLGLLYEHGRGVEKNLERAAELYEHGADLGNREAQNNLGTFLMQGMGLPQDKRRAFSLFQSAAEQGYGVAMRNLGNCYQYAYGTDGNMKKAMEWYERALDVLDDPELAQKVQLFRQMEEVDPDWGKDYPERIDTPKEEKLDSPLKEALRAQGRPYDDEAINNLSVEEVFELLGTVEHEYEQYAAASELTAGTPEAVTADLPEVPETPEAPAAEAPVMPEEHPAEPEETPVPETASAAPVTEPAAEPEPVREEAPVPPELSDVMKDLFGMDEPEVEEADDVLEVPAAEAVTEVPETEIDEPEMPELPAEPVVEAPASAAEDDLPEAVNLPEEAIPAEAVDEPDISEIFAEPVAEAPFPDSLELTRAMNDFGVLEPESAAPAEESAPVVEEEPEEEVEFRERIYDTDVMARKIRNPKYRLTYSEGRNSGNERYRISIPDGFKVEPHAEGRDFIAWLPGENNADYNSSRITFYAGAEAGKNRIDTRLLTPQICALLTESNYWQADALRLLAEKNRLIVLNKEHPAGSIIAGYNEGNFMYNISIVMPGYIKTMRAQVLGAEEEDIPSCDRMVLEWVRTMTSAEDFEETKALNDSYFSNQPLTARLASEWKETCDLRYTVIERSCRDNVDLARQRYAKGAYGVDGEAEFRADLQEYLDTWAKDYGNFLESGVSAIKTLKTRNPESPALTKLLETFRPAVNGISERSETVTGIDDVVRAAVPYMNDIRARFAELDKQPDEEKEVIPTYRELTYHENHEFTLGGLTGLLPDQMITFDQAPESDVNDPEFLTRLHGIYTLAAIPSDYHGGFNRYTEGRFCVNIGIPVRNSGFGVLFENGTETDIQSQLVQFLTANLKRNNKFNEHYPVEYVCGGKDYAVVAAQISGNTDPEPAGASFVFLVLDQDDLYQGNIYFHSEGSDEQFREAAYNWLETFVRNSTETAQPISTEPEKPHIDAKPETREDIEKKFRADRLRNALKQEWKWISLHGKEIARNPQINVEDALFVFTGAAGLADFPEILNRLEAKGGIRRNLVTGRTDYLVCNPAEAGETKIAAARELKQKGSEMKIILLNDLRKALGMEEVDLRRQLEELTGTEIEPEVRLEDIEPEEETSPTEVDEAMSDMGDSDDRVRDFLQEKPEATAEPSVAEEPAAEAETPETIAAHLFEDLPMDVPEDRDPAFDTLGFNMTAMETAIHEFTESNQESAEREMSKPEAETSAEPEPAAEEPVTAETEESESADEEPAPSEPAEPEAADEEPEEASVSDETDAEHPEESEAEAVSEEPETIAAHLFEDLPMDVLEDRDPAFDTLGFNMTAMETAIHEFTESNQESAEREMSKPEAETSAEPEPAAEEPVTAETEESESADEEPAPSEPAEPEAADEEPEEASVSDETDAEHPEESEAEAVSEEPETNAEESSEPEETEPESEEPEDEQPKEKEEDKPETEVPAEETEKEPEEDPAVKAYTAEALSYLDKKDAELKSFREDWDSFSSTVARTLMLKIQNGIKPKVNEGEDGDKNLSFDSDTSEADEFVDSIPEKVDRKLEKLSDGIREFNTKLEGFESGGLEEMTFLKLCRAFTAFKEAGRNLSLKFTSRDISYPLSEEVEAIGTKWEEIYHENQEKLEAFEKEEAEKAPAEPEKPSEPEVLELKPAEDVTPAVPVSRALPGGDDDTAMLTRTTVHKQIEALLAQDSEDEEDDAEEPEGKSGNKVLLIVLAVVVLACIGVAVYWFVTNYLPAHQGTSALESEGTVLVQAVCDLYEMIL